MAITSNVLLSSPANVYVSSGNTAITAAYFCNTSSVPTTFNVYLVASGGTNGAGTQIYNSIQLAGNDTYVMDWEKIALSNGDMLRANATNTTVTATISYVGI